MLRLTHSNHLLVSFQSFFDHKTWFFYHNYIKTYRFLSGIYSCKELDDMKPEQTTLYYS